MPHTSANYGGGPHLVNAKGAGIKNMGGTVFYGGTPGGSNPAITNSLGLTYIGYGPPKSEPGPYNGGLSTGALNIIAGTFAKMTAGQYIILGFTKQIAGNANTLLSFTANFSPHFSRNMFHSPIRTTHYVSAGPGLQGGWYYVTGVPVNRTYSNDVLNADKNPGSYAIPGDLTFMSTGQKATTQSYLAKTD